MKSNGGVASASEVARRPITTVLSGPAAGALGAGLLARTAGFARVLTLDGGGTSTDVSVVLGGEPTLTTEGSVGAYPSRIPMIDVVTVGAGGGSVAWISPEGRLKVGPRSAGADPGPLCYGRGGTEPTVTDAHVVLGRIPPHLLGGRIPLDPDAARAGLADLAQKLGMGVEECARGILEISAWNQANALRQISVKRGLDVRDFTLATFGGSGLAARLPAHRRPRAGRRVSCRPTLATSRRSGCSRSTSGPTTCAPTSSRTTGSTSPGSGRRSTRSRPRPRRRSAAEGFAPGRRRLERSADLRYAGQAYEVRVPVPAGPLDAAIAQQVAESFHAAHQALYGYAFAVGRTSGSSG